ncbi:acyl carrier protein [Artomyces pyxidatus]|uniref:Acyl carrier protein n=1 Tax=Artomyces pyxidatus TaxID=48021 RepID=A0ACB8TH51_9AGAM|nr:acyl carrier protein [Artomyces pyxidatus]
MSFARAALRSAVRPRLVLGSVSRLQQVRLPLRAWYSAGGSLQPAQIEQRVLDVLKGFEKVNHEKLTTASSFSDDLGLDSLDAVEVVMAVEEEFSIEIPDAEADEIKTVQQAIDYIAKTPEGVS